MVGEQANNERAPHANNQVGAQPFGLPENIDSLIASSETYCPQDVWMEYLATLPISTTRAELHRLREQFVVAVAEYMGVTE